MTDPISRTQLYQRVDAVFHESYPDAPQRLRADSPAHWREAWIHIRDDQLNEEVNRVYWARYPDAPTQLDATSPEWEKWRVIRVCDDLADEVGAPAMRDGGVDGQWESREVVVQGLGPEKVRIRVKGWWVDHYFSGGISALIVPVDGGG